MHRAWLACLLFVAPVAATPPCQCDPQGSLEDAAGDGQGLDILALRWGPGPMYRPQVEVEHNGDASGVAWHAKLVTATWWDGNRSVIQTCIDVAPNGSYTSRAVRGEMGLDRTDCTQGDVADVLGGAAQDGRWQAWLGDMPREGGVCVLAFVSASRDDEVLDVAGQPLPAMPAEPDDCPIRSTASCSGHCRDFIPAPRPVLWLAGVVALAALRR